MKKAVTEKDIETGQKDGKFLVSRDMLLTPGAREFASRKGITLKYVTDEPPKAAAPLKSEALEKLIEDIVVQEVTRRASAKAAGGASPAAATGSGAAASQPARADGSAPAMLKAEAAMDQAVCPSLDSQCRETMLNLSRPESSGNRAIVTVVGYNRPGIVARISAAVAECGGDLADISQVILSDYFSMIFIVKLDGLERSNMSFRIFKERLQDEALRIGQTQILVMHENIFKSMHKV
jgi:ACT domain-containing protein